MAAIGFESAADRIVAEAMTWVGTPYRHQGLRKGVGCDCLGLVLGVWRAIYGEAPMDPGPYAADWAETGGKDCLYDAARDLLSEKPVASAVAGDLILFRWRSHLPAKHAAIMVGPNRFIHAYEGSAVIVSHLVPQWRKRIAGAFTFPDLPSNG